MWNAPSAKASLLFDLELEGFEGFVREQQQSAAALQRLIDLLAALRPGATAAPAAVAAVAATKGAPTADAAGLQAYYDRLCRDAAAALQVAAACAAAAPAVAAAAAVGADAGAAAPCAAVATAPPGADGANRAPDLRLFLEVLTCCGHEAWLRTGKASAVASGAASEGSSPRSAGGAAAVSILQAAGANGADAAAVVAAAMAPPQHTFIVVRAPASSPNPVATADLAPAGPEDSGPQAATAPGNTRTDGISMPQQQPDTMLVVDPNFKERFSAASVAAASPAYRALVAALPDVVVGVAEGLAPLVEFLCEQMESSFRESGAPLPPWREARYMMGNWFPEAADDVAAC